MNGVFIGLLLCDKKEDMDLHRLGVKVDTVACLLPCAIDLGGVRYMRQYGLDREEMERTIMECTNGDTYVVDAPFDELKEHYIKSKAK